MTITKTDAKEDLIGLNLKALLQNEPLQKHQVVFEGKTGRYRGPFETPDKSETLYVNLSTVPMYNNENAIAGGICILNDITNEITAKEEMIRNAYYDMLTKIPNRTLLMDTLERLLVSQQNGKEHFSALLFLDIDNFRKVNENYGHHIGDHLLQQVAKRIDSHIGKEEFFARVSDNKFVILLPKLSTDHQESERHVRTYLHNLAKHFRHPFELSGNEYYLTFTTGVILFNYHVQTPYELLKRAETAMHHAKKTAKGMFVFYSDDMSHSSKERLAIENDLHKAIQSDQLHIHYLPQYEIQNETIESAEALVRWFHPIHGELSPRHFLAIAEESGTITRLEKAIFKKVFSEISQLKEDSTLILPTYFTINVSTMHFLQPYFEETITDIMKAHGVEAHEIQLELPEDGIMNNIDQILEKMQRLHKRGFRFSIDDFGTSHSLISSLKYLPIDTIKIDRRFITNLHRSNEEPAIVNSIIAIGHSFHLRVVAEGVETEQILEKLKSLGCDAFQGYLRNEPMAMEQLKEILARKA